jgi:hypothetical protein
MRAKVGSMIELSSEMCCEPSYRGLAFEPFFGQAFQQQDPKLVPIGATFINVIVALSLGRLSIYQ